jgi:methyltransferase (TIGR00027 family)
VADVRETKPSFTACRVAVTRASLVRPEVPTGDADAEVRLYRSLGGRRVSVGDGHLRRHLAVRTAFFDRETLQAIRGGVQQVVIVGAGYDGRALRFASPEVRWFEVDHPATQADKRARLAAIGAPSVQTAFVAVDLVHDDLVAALGNAGFDAARSSLFVVEGLLGYLPRPVTSDLLGHLQDLSSSGSRLAVAFPTKRPDAPTPERLRRRVRGLVVAALGEPWLTRFDPDEPEQLLTRAQWAVAVNDDQPVRYQGRNGVLIAAEPATASAPG